MSEVHATALRAAYYVRVVPPTNNLGGQELNSLHPRCSYACCMCWQSPAEFAGPGFTLALVPHSCLIFPANKTLACAPAQVVLLKTPGER